MRKILSIVSWLGLCLAAGVIATAIFGAWAINAESVGAHDFGLALFFTICSAIAAVGALWSAPVLGVIGVILLRFHRRAGLRFLAAGIVCTFPLLLVWLLGDYWWVR